jgi:hypothetical protein
MSHRQYTLAVIAAVIGGHPSARLGAQEPPRPANFAYRYRLLGVYDDASGLPLEDVRVTDVLNRNSALTTKTGTVALSFLPDGGGLVRLTKVGYETQTMTISISPADTTPITLVMRRIATQLPAVVSKADSARHWISPGLRGFEERRKGATGYFIADSVLRADEGRPLANVLARVPGVVTKAGSASTMYLLKSPRCAAGGPPQVYLDGAPISPDLNIEVRGLMKQPRKSALGQNLPSDGSDNIDNVPFDLSRFQVSDLAAVEWYPDGDQVPIEFSHTSGRCGALLLWTRER